MRADLRQREQAAHRRLAGFGVDIHHHRVLAAGLAQGGDDIAHPRVGHILHPQHLQFGLEGHDVGDQQIFPGAAGLGQNSGRFLALDVAAGDQPDDLAVGITR